MSSINSSDRNKADDNIRRARETFQQRESENVKKQKKEMRTLAEVHEAEVEALKESHAQQMEDLKSKSRDAITKRDMNYQKEIDELREMHREQLRRVAQDNESKQNRVETTYKSEIEHTNAIAEQQRSALAESFQEAIKEKEGQMYEHHKQTQDMVQESIADSKRRLNNSHQKEMEALVKDRNRQNQEKGRQFEEMRKVKDGVITDLNRTHDTEKQTMTRRFERTVQNERADNKMQHQLAREAFDHGLQENRERFSKASAKEKQGLEMVRGELTESVNNRLNSQVGRLEDEVFDLRRGRDRDNTRKEDQKKTEIKNVRDSFQANIDEYERDRRELVNANNSKTSQEIKKINKANETHVHASNRFFQEKIGMDQVRHEERLSKQQSDSATKYENAETSNNVRFEKLANFNDMEREKMRTYFEQATGSMRENFESTLREMRLRNKSEQDKLFATFADQSRETEKKFQGRLQDITMRYERQINEINERHQKDLKEQQNASEHKYKEHKKLSSNELATQSAQLTHRISKNEESHRRELDDLRRKHEESLANLVKNRQA